MTGRCKPYHLSVDQFLAMIGARIFPDGSRLELLGGVLVAQAARTAPHDFGVGAVGDAIRRVVPEGWVVREEKPIVIGKRSRPEPGLAVIRGPNLRYRDHDPEAGDIGRLIEVADSSDAIGRGAKWRAYAAARIPIYWIVDLDKSRIEAHAEPIGRGKSAQYRLATIHGAEDEVPVVIDGRPTGRVVVKEILP